MTDPPTIDLISVVPVPMNRLVSGTVVWAHVEFRDGTGEKTRPVVVVAVDGRRVTVLPCTTSPRRRRLRGHVELVDLRDAGLTRATGVARNPVTIDRIELLGICGSLSERDRAEVLDTFLPFGASVAD